MPVGASLGTAVLSLFTEDNNFSAGVKSAQTKAQELQAGFLKVGAALTAVGAGFVAAAKSAIDLGDDLAKTSQKVGVSVEDLSALKFAAELSGSSFEGISKSLAKLSKNLNDASMDTGTAKDALAELGIQVLDSEGNLRGANDVMLEVAERFASMEDGSKKTALAMDIFGKSGVELIPFLNQGRDGIKGMTDEAASLGLVMSTDAAQASERFNDALTRLTGAFQGLANTLIESGMLDRLTEIINAVAGGIAEFAQGHPVLTSWIGTLGLLAAAVGPVVAAIGLMIPPITAVIGFISGAAGLVPAIGAVVAVLTGPVGIVIAITAAVAALVYFLSTNETVRDTVAAVWEWIKTFLVDTWETITSAAAAAWEAIRDTVETVLEGLKILFTAALKAYVGFWVDFGKSIVKAVVDLWDDVQKLTETALSISKGLGRIAAKALSAIVDLVKDFAKDVLKRWDSFQDTLSDVWDATWEGIQKAIRAPIDAILRLVSDFTGSVGGAFEGLYDVLVGNSIIPDMMARIGQEFDRLQQVRTATAGHLDGVRDEFRDLQGDVVGNSDSITKRLIGMLSTEFSKLGTVIAPQVGLDAFKIRDAFCEVEKQVVSNPDSCTKRLIGMLSTEFSKLDTVIVPQVERSGNEIKGIFGDIGKSLEGGSGEGGPGLLESLGKLGSGDILGGLGDLKNALGNLFNLDIQGAIDRFIGQFQNIYNRIIEFIEKIIEAVDVVIQAIIDLASSGLNFIGGGVGGILGATLARLAADFISGSGRHDQDIEQNTRFTWILVEETVKQIQHTHEILWTLNSSITEHGGAIQSILWRIRGEAFDFFADMRRSADKIVELLSAASPASRTLASAKALEFAPAAAGGKTQISFNIRAFDGADVERAVRTKIYPELRRMTANRRGSL